MSIESNLRRQKMPQQMIVRQTAKPTNDTATIANTATSTRVITSAIFVILEDLILQKQPVVIRLNFTAKLRNVSDRTKRSLYDNRSHYY